MRNWRPGRNCPRPGSRPRSEVPGEMAISASPWQTCPLARMRCAATTSRMRTPSARRLEILQRVESEFDLVPFDAEAARIFARGRAAGLMIAATALAEGLPLYTTNPADFTG
jgi:predicted nucleic acid-binding protein